MPHPGALARERRAMLGWGAMDVVVDQRFAGPPSMGHGGYVAGLFAVGVGGAVQVTLRRPTPLDAPLVLERHDDGRGELRHGDDLIADAEPATLTLAVPTPPSAVAAAAAESGSPSHRNGRGCTPSASAAASTARRAMPSA